MHYLKCLMADWQGFNTACGRTVTVPHWENGLGPLSTCDLSLACEGEIQPCGVMTCVPAHLPGGLSQPGMDSSAPGLHLVDYSSSEESDHENVGLQDEKLTSSISALDISEDNTPLQAPVRWTSHSGGLLNQPTDLKTSHTGDEASGRVFGCLSELREVVTRLHAKKLFPYNPAPLLKLLGQVENCSL